MHLVDDIYFILADLGRNAYLFHQLADVVYRVIGCGIKFVDIVLTLFVERHARFALIASLAIGGGRHTVNRFGKDTRASSLSYPTLPAEQISMSEFLSGNRIFQRSGQCPLTYH